MSGEDNGTIHRGSCLCGAVKFEAVGDTRWVAHCHCRSCQKATGAAFATYSGYERSRVTFSGEERAIISSSPGVKRGFCRTCGSAMSYESERWADEVHLFVTQFDDPDAFRPAAHVYMADSPDWLHIGDDLPKFEKFSG